MSDDIDQAYIDEQRKAALAELADTDADETLEAPKELNTDANKEANADTADNADEKPSDKDAEKDADGDNKDAGAEDKSDGADTDTSDAADDEDDDDLAAYLPPDDYVASGAEQEAKTEPADATDYKALYEAEQRENERIKQAAERGGVNTERPSFDLTAEELQELEDTSPVAAKYIIGLTDELKALKQGAAKPAESPKAAEQPVAKPVDLEPLNQAIAANKDLDYWFNYKLEDGETAPPRAVKRAQQMAVDIDTELMNSGKFEGDLPGRLAEAAKLVKHKLQDEIEKRAVTRTASMAAAPGSPSEGDEYTRITKLPASEMHAAIENLPEPQQSEYKARLFG